MVCSQSPGTGPAPSGSIVMRVPPDPWYLPVTRAVATEIAVRSGLDEDAVADARIVTTEVVTALCADPETGSTAQIVFRLSAEGLRIVGKSATRHVSPPDESTPLMRLLRQVAVDVAAVCVLDGHGGQLLRVTATVLPPLMPA